MKNKGYILWLSGLLSLILLITLLPGVVQAEGPAAGGLLVSSAPTVISTINLLKGGEGPADIALNTATNRIYVANWDTDNVAVFDGSDDSLITLVNVGDCPQLIAVNSTTERIYVVNVESNSISVIDGNNNQVTATIDLESYLGDNAYLDDIAVNPATNRVYVADGPGNRILVIDSAANQVIGTINGIQTPAHIAVNPVTNRMYVTNRGPNPGVSVIDGVASSIIATIELDMYLGGMAINPETNLIYVSNYSNDTISVIDGGADSVIASIPVGQRPLDVAVNPVTSRIYSANILNQSISVIDGDSHSVLTTLEIKASPLSIAVNPGNNRIYTANMSNNSLTVVDGSSDTVIDTVKTATGAGALGVAVNPVTNCVYVSNERSDDVSVINAATGEVESTVEVGLIPLFIDVNPETNRVYVTNSESRNISVIDGATARVIDTINLVDQPEYIIVNPVTNRIYVTIPSCEEIAVIDGVDNSLIAWIPAGSSSAGIALNPLTNRIYTANCGDGTVSVIDGSNNVVMDTLEVDAGPGPELQGIEVNPLTNRIYVGKPQSNCLSVIDGSNNSIVNEVQLESAAFGIAVNPDNNRLYVVNNQSDLLLVIDGSTDSQIGKLSLEPDTAEVAVNPFTGLVYVINWGLSKVSVIQDGIYISAGDIEDGVAGSYCSTALQAIYGTQPYTWDVREDTLLPPALSLQVDDQDTSRAVVSGIPISPGGFFFVIRSTDAAMNSAERYFRGVIAPEPVFPAAPTGLKAVPESDKQVTLRWSDSYSGETGFYIERKKHTDIAFKQIGKTGADTSTYIDKTGLKALTAYDYRVCAYKKNAGKSGYTDIVTATTLSTPPKAPKLVSPKNNAAGLDLAPALEWSAPAGAVYYTLEVSNDKKFTTFILDQSGLTETSYTIPEGAVEWNTTYYWRVKASGSDGSPSNRSAVSKFKTAIGTAPTGLAAIPLAYNQVGLSWNMTGYDVTGYYIERKKPTETKFRQTGKTAANINSYPDKSGLKASTEYEYRVCAYLKGAGNSLYSDIVSVTTLSTPPKAPKLKSPKNNATGLGLTPTLEWTAPEGAASYTLEIAKDQKFTAIIRNEKGLYVNQYTIPYVPVDPEGKNLEGITTYYWRVNARGSDESPSNWSSVRKFKTAFVPLPEVAPGGLTVMVVSDRQIDLSWTADAANADGVCIERKIITDAEYTQIARLEAAIVSYSDKKVEANNAYSYRIRAYNGGGYSDYSEAAPAITPPAVPGLILPVDGAQITGNTPTLNWSQPSGWWKFNLQVSAAEDFSAPEIDKKTVGAWYDVQNNELAAHTVYYWRVSATNNLGATSAWSAYRSFLTGEGVDTQPPEVKERSPEDGTTSVPVTAAVKATFSEPMRASSISEGTFLLKDGDTPVAGTVSYTDSGQTATFTPSAGLLPDTVYTATVTAGVQDLAGNHLPQNISWVFSTGEGVMVSIPDYAAPAVGTLDVNLNISPVSGLKGYQIVLEYDPAVLEIRGEEGDTMVGVTEGLIGTTEVPLDGWTFVKDENGVVIPGQVLFIGYFTGGRTVTGAGYLAQVHFNILGAAGASSPLNFTARGTPGYILYLPSSIIDKDAKAIPCTFVNGAVNVIPQIAAQILP